MCSGCFIENVCVVVILMFLSLKCFQVLGCPLPIGSVKTPVTHGVGCFSLFGRFGNPFKILVGRRSLTNPLTTCYVNILRDL